jgi:hypothetical protein
MLCSSKGGNLTETTALEAPMSNTIRTLLFVLAITPLCTFADSPTTAPAHDPAWYRLLAARLDDETPGVRDSAQKELDSLTSHDMDPLLIILHSVVSDDAQSRVKARMQIIAEEVLHPARFTINLDNASWDTVASEIGKAAGTSITPDRRTDGNNAPTFTLHVTDAPFWEVFGTLSNQCGLSLYEGPQGPLEIYPNRQQYNAFVTVGSFAFFPGSVSLSRDLQAAAPHDSRGRRNLSLNYTIAADPSVHVARIESVGLTSVIDDKGNILYHGGPQQPPRFGFPTSHIWNDGVGMKVPDDLGSKIASAKGSVTFALQTGADSIEIPCTGGNYDPVLIGDCRLSIRVFNQSGNNCTLVYGAEKLDARGRRVGGNSRDSMGSLSLIDDAGKEVWSGTLVANDTVTPRGTFSGPLKLRVSIPTGTMDYSVDFEFKDIPLP